MLPDVSSFSPLLNAIHSRKLCTFTRVALAVIESSSLESKDALVDAQLISGLLDIRAMHELDCISGNGVSEAKSNIVRIVLEMLSMESSQDLMRWSASLVSRWYKETSEWKATFEKILKSTVSFTGKVSDAPLIVCRSPPHQIVDSQWPTILKISRSLLQALPEDVRKPVVTFMLPIMNDVSTSAFVVYLHSDQHHHSKLSKTLPHSLLLLLQPSSTQSRTCIPRSSTSRCSLVQRHRRNSQLSIIFP